MVVGSVQDKDKLQMGNFLRQATDTLQTQACLSLS